MKYKQVQQLISHMIEANSKNLKPMSICLEGPAGMGKTSMLQDFARQKGFNPVLMPLPQIEDPSDLIGLPVPYGIDINGVECVVKPGNDYARLSTRYAKPAWAESDKPIFLILDDFTRANNAVLQAVMFLVENHSYVTWSLPEGSFIALTSNPATDDYTANEIDVAFKTRIATVPITPDWDGWLAWADANLPSLLANFGYAIKEPLEQQTSPYVNYRTLTTWFRLLDCGEESVDVAIAVFGEQAGIALHSLWAPYKTEQFSKFVDHKAFLKATSPEDKQMLLDSGDTIVTNYALLSRIEHTGINLRKETPAIAELFLSKIKLIQDTMSHVSVCQLSKCVLAISEAHPMFAIEWNKSEYGRSLMI